MKDNVPLSYLRIWCRNHQAWLSFKTRNQERFLVSPEGYFIELPDGSVARISPRTVFEIRDHLPSVSISDLVPRKQVDEDAFFVSVPLKTSERHQPLCVPIKEVQSDPLASFDITPPLQPLERFLLLRVLENGIMMPDAIAGLLEQRQEQKKTVGELLLNQNVCHWESLLSLSLDIRPPSRLDPPSLRAIIERREWELTGEILIILNKINRTELEHALKLKREATQALGQILTAMGACPKDEIDLCLGIQDQLKNPDNDGVALIGRLLVIRGVISEADLEEALWKQRVTRQPLATIFISMGACTEADIDGYIKKQGSGFQQAIDEAALSSYLVKNKIITRVQLDEALRIQLRGRQVLGEILVAHGLCTACDIDEVIALQREVRYAYRSGVERLGDLLIKQGKVPHRIVEEALETQSIGRQPLGAILAATGACTVGDISMALEVQKKWRARPKEPGDRLGEVLVKHGIVTAEALEAPLLQHMREEKPLGRILVETGACAPESIIGALIERDNARQEQFLSFVRAHRGEPPPPVDREAVPSTPAPQAEDGSTFVNKIQAAFRARQKEKKS